jgi:hypothetical protein
MQNAGLPAGPAAQFLDNARKLIPAEAVAAYISCNGLAAATANPRRFEIVVALVFLVVAVWLRLIGSRPSTAKTFLDGVQPLTIGVCFLAYIALVYASGGQIWFHDPIADQEFYGQIASIATGILAPTLVPRIG